MTTLLLVLMMQAEPDVVVRGKTTTIVVTGDDAQSLKTIAIDPPNGVRIEKIMVHPMPVDGGVPTASVLLSVDATAAPGERTVTTMVGPTMSSDTRGGSDPQRKAISEAMAAIAKRETKAYPVGTIHINAHEVKLLDFSLQREGAKTRLRVMVIDAANDFLSPPPAASELGRSQPIRDEPSPVVGEVHCGQTIAGFELEPPIIESRNPSEPDVVTGGLDLPRNLPATGCEIRVRVRDRAGNLSRWLIAPMPPR